MAYMNQERKRSLAPSVKSVLREYGAKGTLSVHNHSTLCLTISSSPFEFDHEDVNHYHYDRFYADNPVLVEFMSKIVEAMNEGNHDNSDIQSDYFDVGWYISIRFGRYGKPHVCTAKES